MPDIFGNATPQEIQAQEQEKQLLLQEQQKKRFNALMQNSSGVGRGGLAIGSALRGAFDTTRATSKARDSEEARLVEETGMSVAEARAQAKQNVPRGRQEVESENLRKAKELRKLTGGAEGIIDALEPSMGLRRAQAQTARIVSVRMRLADMPEEANKLMTQAALLEEEQDALDSVKALDAVNLEQAKLTRDRTDTGKLRDGQDERARLEHVIDTSKDPDKIEEATRRLVEVKQDIANTLTKHGMTEQDAIHSGLITPEKPVKNSLQQSLIDSGNQLDLLQSMGRTFDPDFLTYQGQTKQFFRRVGDKFNLLSDGQKEELVRFTAFKRNSLNGLNRYIKLITGAQMSEAEADRLRKAYPDVENASPSEFVAAYTEVVKEVMAYRRRAQAALRGEGLDLLPDDFGKSARDADGNLIDGGSDGADVKQFYPTDSELEDFVGFSPSIQKAFATDPAKPLTTDEAVTAADALIESFNK